MNDLEDKPPVAEKDEQPRVTESDRRPRRDRRHRGGIVGPILLVAAGIFFLLSNLGIINWSIWDAVWRLWPIVLIAVGLDLLIGRRSLLASLFVAIVTIGLLVGGFFWLGAGPTGGAEITDTINQPLSGAESADVTLGFGVGRATLGALAAGSESLVEGRIERPDDSGVRIEQTHEMDGDVAIYRLRTEGSIQMAPFFGRSDANWIWDLQLNPNVPMRLTVNTGVGSSTLDLRELTLEELHVDTGVGETTVMLPGEGRLEASVNGGIGELIVEIPDGIPARIDVDTGLGDADIPGDFEREGDVYVSPGYDDALDRIDLEIDAGIGQITVRTYGGR